MKKFNIGQKVFHVHLRNRKFRIVREIHPSQYEIEDPDTGKQYYEPTDRLLDINEMRDNLINNLIDENTHQ